MKLLTTGLALGVLSIAVAAPALAGSGCGYNNETQAKPGLKEISVEQLAQFVTAEDAKSRSQYAVYDANNADTRVEFGIVPGATLLSDYAKYNPSAELPANKEANLVFYCSNTRCTAAPKAAKKALESGYVNVYVMPAGIMGWNEAGQPTTKVKSRS